MTEKKVLSHRRQNDKVFQCVTLKEIYRRNMFIFMLKGLRMGGGGGYAEECEHMVSLCSDEQE